ncbi:alpha/beta hydrolase [Pseudalkalibacillus hwajinpoensis]|uniref:alpha/beta fold hydrolase n=1 Tax=Guptibacillus hwajinpoensis TaxID=208199 RepID=UPI00325ADE49
MPFIDVNETPLYYEDYGPKDAPVLVFSHSLFFSSYMFHHQVEHFSKDYRVICYDHRGQGRSGKSYLENLSMDTLTDDAAALIEALGISKCHFIGNSMGGFIALRLAARRSDLLSSCVVLGSSGEAEYKQAEFQPLVSQLQNHGAEGVVDTLMYIMFGDASLEAVEFEKERNYWRTYMKKLETDIGDAAHQVIHRTSILEELSGVKMPVLAVAGEQDHAYTIQLSENIAKAVENGRCEVLGRAGHSVALEKPNEVNKLLERHFARMKAHKW